MTEFLIKSTIAMGVLLGLYYILFEREKIHRFNRFYLLSALAFSLALPFINIPVYVEAEAQPKPVVIEQAMEFKSLQAPEAITESPTVAATPATVIAPQPDTNYWPYVGWGLYLLVAFALAIRFIANIIRFYILKRNNVTVSYNGTSVILLNSNVLPHTFLGNIYLNKEEYENKLIAPELFTHELVHVKQFHTLDILFIEALKTIFWFNPLFYFYKKAIQLNHEFLADEKVIDSTANTVYYQSLLLEKASVGNSFSIASNLNFSLTKKRFIMMTKTTNKTKGILLKLAILPASAGLLYFLSTQTVVLANTTNSIPPVFMAPEAAVTSVPEAITRTTKDTVKQQAVASTNTADPEARKNEYYRGVRIVITDAQKGKYIDKPYEHLTAEERHYYLPEAPDKKGKATGIQDADYKFSLYTLYEETKNIQFFVDDKKVSRDEVLKYKKEDFATYAAKFSGVRLVNGKPEGNHRSFFYTYAYFDKYLKNINDHYPDKTLKITITAEPKAFLSEFADEAKATGKTEFQLMEEKEKKELEADYYPTVEEIKEQNRQIPSKFTGEDGDFDKYITKNLNIDDKLNGKQLIIMFDINTDGTISDVRTGNNDPEIEAEIQRVFKNSPRWIPAQNGKRPQRATSLITLPLKN